MKSKASLAIISALFGFLTSNAQRYITNIFPELDSLTGVVYGTALDYQSNSQDLLLDFYQPADDLLAKRPLIIYVHGGGFNTGSRLYPSVQEICRRMAMKGYAVANIDYRLDPNFDIYNSTTDRRAMTDAMHDAKQAIRYFKANAVTYGIDTSLIFIGGESAGAATAMMASFVDKQSEMTAYPMAKPNNPIGDSGNLSFSNNVAGTLCLCGLLIDTTAMESSTDPPILWTHGDADSFIPISFSYNIVFRALHIGLPIQTKVYKGAVHCPWYFGNPSWSTYLDSTIIDITTFLYPKVRSTTSVNHAPKNPSLSVYPNPFRSQLKMKFESTNSRSTIKITSSLGQIVFEGCYDLSEGTVELDLSHLAAGIYYLLVENENNRAVRKIVKECDG